MQCGRLGLMCWSLRAVEIPMRKPFSLHCIIASNVTREIVLSVLNKVPSKSNSKEWIQAGLGRDDGKEHSGSR